MNKTPQSVAMLADLRDFFLETLVPRIARLDELLAGAPSIEPRAAAELRRIAHGLRGSGGSYGYPEVTALATATEEAPLDELATHASLLVGHLRELTRDSAVVRSELLLIEPDDAHAERLIVALSSPTRRVERVASATAANNLLRDRRFKLIVLDSVVDDLDVRTMLMQFRERFQTTHVPVIVITVGSDVALHADCLVLGALHVFPATIDERILAAAATAAIERAEHTHRISALDPLTDLPNRSALHETLCRWISIGGRSQDPLSLGLIGIDGLAGINNSHGHLVGDELLRRVGLQLKRDTRTSDYVARWGAEEFIVLFFGADASGGRIALERIRAQLEDEPLRVRDDVQLRIAIRAGVTDVATAHGPEETIGEAYRLLFQARQSGAARIVGPAPECALAGSR